MFSGSTDSIKCVLVAKPTRSQALCSHFLKKHSCFCTACIVTSKQQSELKHQQGAWGNGCGCLPWAKSSTDVVECSSWLWWCYSIWFGIQFSKADLNYRLPEELRGQKAWWLVFSKWLTPSHGNQQHLHTRLSHPAPFQTVIFAFCPQLCQTLQLLPRHVNHWLISEALRGGGRAEPAPWRGHDWTRKDVLLDWLIGPATEKPTENGLYSSYGIF